MLSRGVGGGGLFSYWKKDLEIKLLTFVEKKTAQFHLLNKFNQGIELKWLCMKLLGAWI